MTDVLGLLAACIVFAAAMNIYAVAVSWPEVNAVGGVRKFLSWPSAIVSAAALQVGYFLLVVLVIDHYRPHLFGEIVVSLGAQSALVVLAVLLGFMPFSAWLLRWRRTFYDGAFADHSAAVYHHWAIHHRDLRHVESWHDAVIDLYIWLELRTRDNKPRWFVNFLMVLLAVLVVPGVTMAVLSVMKFAASEHLPRHPDAGGAVKGWLNRF